MPVFVLILRLSIAICRKLRLRNNHADVEIDAWPDGKLRRPVRISDASLLLQAGFGPGHLKLIDGSKSIVSSPVKSKHLDK